MGGVVVARMSGATGLPPTAVLIPNRDRSNGLRWAGLYPAGSYPAPDRRTWTRGPSRWEGGQE